MKINAIPHIATHPGLLLKEELHVRQLKQNEIAAELGISPSQFNEILKGKRPITPELSILLGAALDMPEDYWYDLQSNFNLDTVNILESVQKRKKNIEEWRIIKDYIPLKYLKKQSDLLVNNIEKDIHTILEMYEYKSIEHLKDSMISSNLLNNVHFKKSNKLSSSEINIKTWISFVKYTSKQISCSKFSNERIDELLLGIKDIFLKPNILDNLFNYLKDFGVKLVVKEKPDQAPIDGAAMWIQDNPILALTLRHKRLDNLIFTVYHELGHIFLHQDNLKSEMSFLDNMDEKENNLDVEKQANFFARNSIVSDEEWSSFVFDNQQFNDKVIKDFSVKVKAHPSSIRGRLCHEGLIPYSSKTSIDNQLI